MTPFSSEPEDTLPRPSESSTQPRESERPVGQEPTAEASDSETPEEGTAEDAGTLKPHPRRSPDRRLDAGPGDPEGTHVCAPTDA